MFGLGPMELIIVFYILLIIPIAVIGYIVYLLRRLVKLNEEKAALMARERDGEGV